MKKQKLFRILLIVTIATVLAGTCLAAAAAGLTGDISGDGKITAFDAQLLAEYKAGKRTLTDEQIAASGSLTVKNIMDFVLGVTPACADFDGDGIYEIYSAEGLSFVAEHPELDYILINDLDLEGADWTPIVGYSGTFDGNGKIISNFSITKSMPTYTTPEGTAINMGFFGDTAYGAEIKNVHLRNVTVTATEDAQFVSLLAGSSRSPFTGCTATGTIIDNRESRANATYIGIMAGRICNAAADKMGSMEGGTNVTITDSAGVKTTGSLCARATFVIANSDNIQGQGLIGWHPDAATISGTWADTSNDSRLLSEKIQARQDTVVNYMNTMGTAPWIPSENLTYTPEEGGGKTYYKGTTYYGLPYNRNYGSYERFLSALNEDGTTRDGLGSCIWNETDGYHGFVQLMGNNCSSAVAWAWMRVSPVIVAPVPSHSIPYHGGAYVRGTSDMIPNENNRAGHGVYPVGSWTGFSAIDPETGKITNAAYDDTLAAYACTEEKYSGAVLQTNGADVIKEAYAQAHKGDALVAVSQQWSATLGVAGHARLIAADPIVIRNVDGTIDANKSYMVTTEQGASTGDTSTWRVNYTYSFRTLLDDSAASGSTGYWRTYLPVTIRALRDETTRASYVRPYTGADAVTGPTQGKVYSNYRIISTTVTVKNGSGVVYNGEVFTGISSISSVTSGNFQTVDLSGHSEAFAAADLADGAYTFTVQVLTSDGVLHTLLTDQPFTYTTATE